MNKNVKNTPWKKAFASILNYLCGVYSVTPEMLVENKADSSSARKWISGERFPNRINQEVIVKFFIKKAQEKKPDFLYRQIYKKIERYLGDIGFLSMKEISNTCKSNTGLLIESVFRLCFGEVNKIQIKNNQNVDLSIKVQNHVKEESLPKIKVVVFDFDGTLTSIDLNKTTWEALWVELGYDINYCKVFHELYNNRIIDHLKWCEITEYFFKKKHLHRQTVEGLTSKIQLLPGTSEVLKYLYEKDIKIYIVSGSILNIIKIVLNENSQYIDGIKANDFFFSTNGFLQKIKSTLYDFEGKSIYIQELITELGILDKEVLFVGNSINDEFAYNSGARTLCINPRNTNYNDKNVWNDCIVKCKDLRCVLKFIFPKEEIPMT